MNEMTRPAQSGIAAVRARVAELTPEFARALPPGIKPERFSRVVLTAIQQNPELLVCTQKSLWGACMKAAQDGLLPDGREGAIVPRWNSEAGGKEAHWMPMVAGIIAKAKRKGSVAGLVANVVYDGEDFEVLLGDEERITHRRDVRLVKRGKEIAVYAVATMKDGSKEREVMPWEQVLQVRAASQGGGAKGPWKTWPEEMARKSCIRRLSKRLPSLEDGDDDLRRTVERVDELYDFGKPAASAPVLPPQASVGPSLAHDPVLDAEAGEDAPAETVPEPVAEPSETMRAVAERVQQAAPDRQRQAADRLLARISALGSEAELEALEADETVRAGRAKLWGPLNAEIEDALAVAFDRLTGRGAPGDAAEPFPGDDAPAPEPAEVPA